MLGSASSAQILKCWDWIQKSWSKLFHDRNFKMVSQSFHIQMMESRYRYFFLLNTVEQWSFIKVSKWLLWHFQLSISLRQCYRIWRFCCFFSPQQPLNTYKFLCISRYILENILSYSCQLKRVSRKLILSFRKWNWWLLFATLMYAIEKWDI